MKCKIFNSRSLSRLEDEVNKWLEEHWLANVKFIKYSTTGFQEPAEYITENSVIIFYEVKSER